MKKQFTTAMSMAIWINKQNFTALQQELLMQQGIKSKGLNALNDMVYTITIHEGMFDKLKEDIQPLNR